MPFNMTSLTGPIPSCRAFRVELYPAYKKEAFVTDDSQDRNSTHTDPSAKDSGGGDSGSADKPKKAPISFGAPPVAPASPTAWNVLPSAPPETAKFSAPAPPQPSSPSGKAPLSFSPATDSPAAAPQLPTKPKPSPPLPVQNAPPQKPQGKKPESGSRTAAQQATEKPPVSESQRQQRPAAAPSDPPPPKAPRVESNDSKAEPSAKRGDPQRTSPPSEARKSASRQSTDAPKAPAKRSPRESTSASEGATRPRPKNVEPRSADSSPTKQTSRDLKSASVTKQGGKFGFTKLTVPKRTEPKIVGPQVQLKQPTEDPTEEVKEAAVRFAPPWLVSMLIHFALVILLVLLTWNSNAPDERVITATYAEQLGEQLEQEIMILDTEEFLPDDVTSAASVDLPVQDDMPLPATLTELSLEGTKTAREAEEESFGAELSARGDARTRRTLVQAYGGNATTEQAVAEALEWLKRNQRRDGSWSMTGPYSNAGSIENPVAATAMALLAFQGAGHTDREGTHAAVVAKGWKFLLGELDGDGNFIQDGLQSQQRLYTQAQASIALCELYAMTRDEALKPKAQSTIDYAVRIQSPEGGWRYIPGEDADTSVTGWFVMALQSARMGGLRVPQETLDNVERFLDSVAPEGEGDYLVGSRYQYRPSRAQPPTHSMTAEALLCRQYMGWQRDDPRLVAGMEYLQRKPITWGKPDVYYWYYATQVAHHMEGDAWRQWNNTMRQVIPENQVQSGREKGSWDPRNDEYGNKAGRLFMTCLCTYMLEVYYRHLPIYSKDQILGTR